MSTPHALDGSQCADACYTAADAHLKAHPHDRIVFWPHVFAAPCIPAVVDFADVRDCYHLRCAAKCTQCAQPECATCAAVDAAP